MIPWMAEGTDFPEAPARCVLTVVDTACKKSPWAQMDFCLGVRDVAMYPERSICLSEC